MKGEEMSKPTRGKDQMTEAHYSGASRHRIRSGPFNKGTWFGRVWSWDSMKLTRTEPVVTTVLESHLSESSLPDVNMETRISLMKRSFEVCLNQTSVAQYALHYLLPFSQAEAQTSCVELPGQSLFSQDPEEAERGCKVLERKAFVFRDWTAETGQQRTGKHHFYGKRPHVVGHSLPWVPRAVFSGHSRVCWSHCEAWQLNLVCQLASTCKEV
ncbi:uncharacterized protein LOC120756735 [Hirundo rustica]|uniref:uncharacterized protein LOC120756735 n=1 Tax=Hirundo rustica TaxID=43150 RepID=UPI001A93DA22|nr:uncharacterized protein LOC120756735 [Hirundo rustica]